MADSGAKTTIEDGEVKRLTITAVPTQQLTFVQALNDALDVLLSEREDVVLLGQDIGKNGGVFRVTDGLFEKYGDERVTDTPLAESGIVGTAIGLAISGFRPIAEIQFLGFIYPSFNQIMTHATRIRMRTLGRYHVPLVIRAPYGAGVRAPEIHSDSVEALFTHMPGIKVVVPSHPADAKGLLIASVEEPDPVLFLEPMRNYRAFRAEVPEGYYTVELGRGNILKEGTDVTIVAWGAMVPVTEQAVAEWEKESGIRAEVIDLRTLYPFDRNLLFRSVRKTGRLVIVHEAHGTGGVSGDIVSAVTDDPETFFSLYAPIERVTGFDVPVPLYSLEQDYLPDSRRIQDALTRVMSY